MSLRTSFKLRPGEDPSLQSPVPLENVFSEFYEALGRYDYSLAHRILRFNSTNIAQSPFGIAYDSLIRLTASESMYSSYAFLKQKWFKRDSPGMVYHSILEDLMKMINICASSSTPVSIDVKFFSELFQQTCTLIHVRQKLMTIYRNISSSQLHPNYESLVSILHATYEEYKKSFTHKYFDLLRFSFLMEVNTLKNLCRVQLLISEFNFKDSAMLLFQTKNDLDSWKQKCFLVEAKKSEGSTNVSAGFQVPHNYRWLVDFHSTLLSKFTFFFNRTLTKMDHQLGLDFKSQSARTDIDYFSAIRTFQKRTDAMNISFIYQCFLNPKPFWMDGFACEGTDYTPPTGLSSFPAIFSYPSDSPPIEHWPNIISIIQLRFKDDAPAAMPSSPSMNTLKSASMGGPSRSSSSTSLSVKEPSSAAPTNSANTTSVPFRWVEEKAHSIYYLVRVDPKVIMVVIFNERQTVKESGVVEFMASISYSLRNGKVFEKLSKH